MSDELQTTIWGLVVFLPLALNLATHRRVDAVGLSGLLVLIWTLSRLFWLFDSPPGSMEWYAPVDFIAGVTCFTVWKQGRQFWKLALTATFATQVALHTAFWAAWTQLGGWGGGFEADTLLWRYVALNNLLFVMQIVCAISPGGRHVAVRTIARVSGRVRRHRHAGAR